MQKINISLFKFFIVFLLVLLTTLFFIRYDNGTGLVSFNDNLKSLTGYFIFNQSNSSISSVLKDNISNSAKNALVSNAKLIIKVQNISSLKSVIPLKDNISNSIIQNKTLVINKTINSKFLINSTIKNTFSNKKNIMPVKLVNKTFVNKVNQIINNKNFTISKIPISIINESILNKSKEYLEKKPVLANISYPSKKINYLKVINFKKIDINNKSLIIEKEKISEADRPYKEFIKGLSNIPISQPEEVKIEIFKPLISEKKVLNFIELKITAPKKEEKVNIKYSIVSTKGNIEIPRLDSNIEIKELNKTPENIVIGRPENFFDSLFVLVLALTAIILLLIFFKNKDVKIKRN